MTRLLLLLLILAALFFLGFCSTTRQPGDGPECRMTSEGHWC